MTVTEILNIMGHIGYSSIESRRKIHIGEDRDCALKDTYILQSRGESQTFQTEE